MEELLYFVKEQYPSVIKEEKKFVNPDIDYIGVLVYLENNYEVPYSNPDSPSITQEKKAELLSVKQKGQAAVAEMKKMAQQAEMIYGLDKCLPSSWLDGSNTKTRKYLWTQMKYMTDSANPVSVSIFVEKGKQDKAYFRISLEIKNDGTDKAGMEQYHKHFELSQKPGLVYVAGSNEWGNPEILDEKQSVVMSKVASGEYKKVQICKVIEQKEGETNDYYHQEVMTAIGEIIPYYNHVLGKSKPVEEKRGWLLTWNPANWTWDEYKEWCEGTKKGETYTISWTCNSKQPQIGDDVFLMKTGAQPRGVIGHGRVVTDSYEGPHYDADKAAEGVTANHIDVEYDWIQNCDKGEKILLQDDLKEKHPQQTWSPMGSGIEIKEPILTMLKEEWYELTSISEYWPSRAEYNPGISKDDWIEMLLNADITNEAILTMLFRMLELGGESTCANLAECYGGVVNAYNIWGRTLGERVHKATGCPLCKDEDRERFYTIPFVGRNVLERGHDRYSWKLRAELKEALESDMLIDAKSKIKAFREGKNNPEYAKNMILYGPPGTGKTYATAVYAVAIIENKTIDEIKDESYDVVFERYNQYKEDGLVAFTTFHQSYGYEEFIEGIKPVVGEGEDGIGYTIEDGVFKAFCEGTKMPENKIVDHNAKIWKVVLQSGNLVSANTVKFECFNEGKIMYDWKTKEEHAGTYAFSQIAHFQEKVNIGDIVVTYAGSGTDIDAIGIVTGDAEYDEKKTSFRWSRTVEWLEINKVRNIKELNGNKYLDNDQLQRLKRVSIAELLKLVEPQAFTPNDKNYVFIIDEINRGNISKIFGELITLIEDTKRAGMDEEAAAVLPYSGQPFSVPSNVYILGTMNTADRSIALMDTALRRRFEFVEMMPDADVLRKMGADKVEDLDVAAMLEKINERITFLYDREHTIGHAFFTKLAKKPTVDTLKSIFEKSVIPLLQEYFYEDYQKIQLVLGDNGKSNDTHKFILDSDVKVKDIFKGSVDDVIDLPEKKYTINPEAFSNIDSYKEII
ncbi:AAA domain-containing protein [Lactonifactor sp. BIOML-A3]|nr:AAA domain-containing protein [Lactonifactor sp. BIOML-A5]MSA10111.1 AAA domain-containing protein [Lactonifactor sp. BIOML-A4]MSA14617.1 AAA domain-containing protein [Lactonifactor sp. BIOML-A3]MSA19039.1 AAA domain-containing protein [Lactonifactor sp. BIOML-A2]MSA39757.1 AAA domain-containing protein [Lactonifactor sp. BIOML-A1]MSB15548.1 AAA domain-containing protein [Lactonifactor sp. BIOML-A6]MSB71030.1 AAA domain-containing protein [Lactonifactor sp. BIOML-A7]